MGLKLEGERIVEMPVAPLVYMTPHMASIYKSGMHRQTDISYSQGLEELFKGYDGAGENPTERRAEGIRYLIEHYGLDGINAELAWQAFIDWKWPAIKIRLEEEKHLPGKHDQKRHAGARGELFEFSTGFKLEARNLVSIMQSYFENALPDLERNDLGRKWDTPEVFNDVVGDFVSDLARGIYGSHKMSSEEMRSKEFKEFVDLAFGRAKRERYKEEKPAVEKAGQPDQENLEALYGKYGPYYSGKAILAAVQLLKAGEFARAADEFEKARNGFEPKKNPQEYKVLEEWRAYAESQAGGRKSLADDDLEAVGELEAVAKDMVANFSDTGEETEEELAQREKDERGRHAGENEENEEYPMPEVAEYSAEEKAYAGPVGRVSQPGGRRGTGFRRPARERGRLKPAIRQTIGKLKGKKHTEALKQLGRDIMTGRARKKWAVGEKSEAIADQIAGSFVLDHTGVEALCPECAQEMIAKGVHFVTLDQLVEKKRESHFGREDPGLHTRCVEYMKGRKGVQNPEALCAKIHYKVTGEWPGEHRGED